MKPPSKPVLKPCLRGMELVATDVLRGPEVTRMDLLPTSFKGLTNSAAGARIP